MGLLKKKHIKMDRKCIKINKNTPNVSSEDIVNVEIKNSEIAAVSDILKCPSSKSNEAACQRNSIENPSLNIIAGADASVDKKTIAFAGIMRNLNTGNEIAFSRHANQVHKPNSYIGHSESYF